MFVAIATDLSTAERREAVHRTLLQYGFTKQQEGLYESVTIGETQLRRLKKELDRLTDSYDALRFFQYPMESTLVISSMNEKRWRRLVVNPGGGRG
jgi:CRISPR-associated protein Cas2